MEERRILVVEDDPLVLAYVTRVFDQEGFRVVEAATAEQAMRLLGDCDDLCGLFTDIDPGSKHNDLDLVNFASKKFPDAVLVIASGGYIPRGGELPRGTLYLERPVTDDEFSVIVQELHRIC